MHKILVFKSGLLGDTLVAIPALHCLRDAFPDSKIVYVWCRVAGKRFVVPPDILAGSGLVDEFYEYEYCDSRIGALFNYLKLWFYCVTRRFDVGVVLEPPYWSGIRKQFLRFCGIRTVIGPDGLESVIKRNENGRLPVVENIVDSLVKLLAPLNIDLPAKGKGRFDIRLSESEKYKAKLWLADNGIHINCFQRLLAVAPGSNMVTKRWPLENYFGVVDILIKEYGAIPIVFGGSEDRPRADDLLIRWKSGLNAAGQLSVREGIALLGFCQLYLGNDTGTMHMAVAAGIPCVAIFSSIDMPGRWEPYGSGHYVFREEVECSGCLLRNCDKDPDRCIDRISPSQVYKKCEEYLLARN